jgi:hypothetical protein
MRSATMTSAPQSLRWRGDSLAAVVAGAAEDDDAALGEFAEE